MKEATAINVQSESLSLFFSFACASGAAGFLFWNPRGGVVWKEGNRRD